MGYAEKYSSTQPWVTTADLYIAQEIPGFAKGHKGKIYFSIDNLANLLNEDWGQVYQIKYPQNTIFDTKINDDGQYVYNVAFGKDANDPNDWKNYDEFKTTASAWRIKFGVKYSF